MEALRTSGEAKDGKFDFPQQEMLFDLSFFLSFFLSNFSVLLSVLR